MESNFQIQQTAQGPFYTNFSNLTVAKSFATAHHGQLMVRRTNSRGEESWHDYSEYADFVGPNGLLSADMFFGENENRLCLTEQEACEWVAENPGSRLAELLPNWPDGHVYVLSTNGHEAGFTPAEDWAIYDSTDGDRGAEIGVLVDIEGIANSRQTVMAIAQGNISNFIRTLSLSRDNQHRLLSLAEELAAEIGEEACQVAVGKSFEFTWEDGIGYYLTSAEERVSFAKFWECEPDDADVQFDEALMVHIQNHISPRYELMPLS